MSWNLFDGIGLFMEVLDFLGSGSNERGWNHKSPAKSRSKKTKYTVEKISAYFTILASIFLLIVFREPLPVQNPVGTVLVIILIGFCMAATCCFALYTVNLFYFRSLLSMVFFCTSLIGICTATVLYLYFESGLF